ncbi:MAG: hypothetical protein HRU20_30770 [Pseudomonadales bacterium]|nr:hypothetical protein [Pseudomonadales bacterium]
MACLLFSNVLRIVFLVLLGIVAELPALAERLNQSMGLLAFRVFCLLAWQALRLSQPLGSGLPQHINKRLTELIDGR